MAGHLGPTPVKDRTLLTAPGLHQGRLAFTDSHFDGHTRPGNAFCRLINQPRLDHLDHHDHLDHFLSAEVVEHAPEVTVGLATARQNSRKNQPALGAFTAPA